ncbi:hypothetical protein [Phocaeicola plebeius]|uniref:hypothetical protein n=1 Tax=Phocaeicola plebeius TaxID=310297 RepID=UPI0026F02938|nr:hypothetical protein [Phocaeicola plebeius]
MRYIAYILFLLSVLSCKEQDFYASGSGNATGQSKKDIDASCSVIPVNSNSNDVGMMSRGIIGQSTVAQLEANFIKWDERVQYYTSKDDYRPNLEPFSWSNDQTKIANASIFSSPDVTSGAGLRSISFSPRLTYQIEDLTSEGSTDPIIVGYISRMVGWYPKTYDVQVGEGVDATVKFTDTDSYAQVTHTDGNTYDCVVFKNKLDGQTDVMMTDMREGRYQLNGFKNNENDIDVQPYGHLFKNLVDGSDGYEYCNYFSFQHYLTAVRLYVRVESSDLSLVSWKTIDDVVFLEQPQTVTIALPTEQSRGTGTSSIVANATPTLPIEGVEPIFGEALKWEDYTNMPIIRTAMAENDAEHPDFADTPSYPIELENTISLKKTYLGYILLEPGKDTDFEIHTDAGVYRATIPKMFGTGDTQTEILKAGNIYNIVVDMKADGSLDIVVGNEDFESFRNLTPYNKTLGDFEYSNCFIISQDMMKKEDGNWYDGFYFQAAVPGRGEKGMITGTGADLYPKDLYFSPHSARILWQDVPYLLTYAELVHGHVRFSLHEKCRTEGLQGNAVIAVYDESGNILWSWHIWVNSGIKDITYPSLTFYDPENSSQYDYDPNSTEKKTLFNVRIMNMNLGATKASWAAGDDPLPCYGFYYQWGRKDPSPIPSSYNYGQSDMTTKPYYYMDEGERKRVYRYLDLSPTVEMGALHPLDIVAPSQFTQAYVNDWLFDSVDQLWGYNPSTKKVEKKTIYDPCPYGYRVADDELFALFYHARENNYVWPSYQTTWSEVDEKGIKISLNGTENYFPFSGWRGHDRSRTDRTNAWYEVGNLGDYQDARVCKNADTYMNHRGRSFLIAKRKFSNGQYSVQDVNPPYTRYITLDYANRASASPVRCVRYDGAGEEPDGTTTTP